MRIVATNPATFLVGFRGCPRHPCVLVTEIDALMNKIADRLDPRPTGRHIFEQSPSQIQQPIAVAETTREKKDDGLVRKLLHRDLAGARHHRIELTGIGHDSVSRQAHMARRRENPAAPIAKTITVAGDRNRGADDDVIRPRQIGDAREMDIEHCDQRSGLRELVLQFVADPKFQSRSLRAADYRAGVDRDTIAEKIKLCQPVKRSRLGSSKNLFCLSGSRSQDWWP